MTSADRKKLAKAARESKPHDPDAEYAKLDDWTKQEARRHADADMDTGKGGWLCQCGACRLVRIALYDGAGNAVRP
jgi:hypothetical protein